MDRILIVALQQLIVKTEKGFPHRIHSIDQPSRPGIAPARCHLPGLSIALRKTPWQHVVPGGLRQQVAGNCSIVNWS